ncbi:LysR substrate-binding domain-containing protein [Mesorhizobium helmanticense]|uniref:LysR family transcriptional regulator n=1 Tax=Mesorhizobium helmanticense TaxID=1776423 RepID=A0A2T4J3G4_9HYPH|nr:LysR substrate-binding domain-containing protein [Mesorhizobium helmanticense]PTE12444.1 LysR family transcriptional regulator [Mesorhizobium helmanticense]
MNNIDTDALATLIAIVDAGGFGAAAHRLGRTQPGVSNTIARLENKLGKKLINRSRRGPHLTDHGELLIGYARRIVAIQDEALAALQPEALAGRVLVGMPDDYLGVFGTPLIERFAAQNPRIQVEIQCNFSSELEGSVDRGDIDIAIITRDVHSLAGEFLRHEPLVWCASPDETPELLDPLPLALFPEKFCRARPHIVDALDRAGRPWRVAWTSSHLPSIQTAISLGKAVTALPASVISPMHRRLGSEDGLPELKPVELALLLPNGARAAVRRMATFIRTEFRAL